MHIYTRSGDKGTTGLANGQRVSKDSAVIEFVGSLDELNASLGLCVAFLKKERDFQKNKFNLEVEVLESIQSDIFVVGAIAAGAEMTFDSAVETSNIEKTIDDYENINAPLKNFILPGGSVSSSQIHLTRTFARKIERQAVGLKSESVEAFLPYLNRLSDLLFVMARYINTKLAIKETIWKS